MAYLKWQDSYLARIGNMSNEQLLNEVIGAAGGDDQDGEFTNRGRWEFSEMEKELRKRLASWLEYKKA